MRWPGGARTEGARSWRRRGAQHRCRRHLGSSTSSWNPDKSNPSPAVRPLPRSTCSPKHVRTKPKTIACIYIDFGVSHQWVKLYGCIRWRSLFFSWTDYGTIKPQFTYSSLYVLSIYVLLFFYILLYIRTQIWFTYFVLRTQVWYTYIEYVKQSTYIEFEYVKWSTHIDFEYILRVILSFQFCKFFDFVLSKTCWWWMADNMLKPYWEKRN